MGNGKAAGKSDPKAEKKAIQDITGCFAAFENRMKPKLKLIDDMKLKCDMCEQGKLDPSTLKFDPKQSLKDLQTQFYKDMANEEKRVNAQLQNLAKLDLNNPTPNFNDILGKKLKKYTTLKVGKVEVAFDTKEYVKNIEKGLKKKKVNLKFVPIKITF